MQLSTIIKIAIAVFVLVLAFWGTIAYVAVHFVTKFW